jgi:hypothetical protein
VRKTQKEKKQPKSKPSLESRSPLSSFKNEAATPLTRIRKQRREEEK